MAPEPSWIARVIDHMCLYKAAGESDFEKAWRWAVKAHPVRGADAGVGTPRLFDESGNVPETLMAFSKRVARNAWDDVRGAPGSGNGPALREFSIDLVDDDVRLSPVMAA